MDMQPADPSTIQVLTVWNPFVLDDTIHEHVEALRAPGCDHSWWGRIYSGSFVGTDDLKLVESKWPWFSVIEEELRHRELVLYVTSFESLHAVRVDGCHVGPLPEAERALAPGYYFTLPRRIPLWFRVRDIRALAWRSLHVSEQLQQMSEIGFKPQARAFVPTGWSFDPYAAKPNLWPVPVGAPGVATVFPGTEKHFRAPGTAHPQSVEQAQARIWDECPHLKADLAPSSISALATARLLLENPAHGTDPLDPACILIAIARTVEFELCGRLIGGIRQRLERVEHPRTIGDFLETEGWPASSRPLVPPTIGQSPYILPALQRWMTSRGGPSLEVAARPFLEWVSGFARLRNQASHGDVVPADLVSRVWEEVVAPEGRLHAILRARAEVERW